MEENRENTPRLLLKPKIFTTSNAYVNSSNVGTSHFTIRVTDFSNVPSTCELIKSDIISNDVTHSITKIAPSPKYFSASPVVENLPGKKRIKMSEEVPSKRVVLVLPDKILTKLKSTKTQNDIKILDNLSNENYKIIVKQPRTNQTTKGISDKINKLNGIKSINLIPKIDTNEEKSKTEVVDISFQNDSIASSTAMKNSSLNINGDSIQELLHFNTSTPKSQRNSSQVIPKVKLFHNSKLNLAKKKSIQMLSPSVSQQKSSIKPFDKTSESKKISAVLSSVSSSSLSSSSTETNKFIGDSINPNSSLRQIKINGLKLKPVSSGVLNNLKLQNRIKICDRSELSETGANKQTNLQPTEIFESLVTTTTTTTTTTTVESPQKINETNYNCEECSQLRSEVDAQLQTIFSLKRDLAESIVLTKKKSNLNYKTDDKAEDERYSEALKELDDINKRLRDELKREQFRNNKLKIGVDNCDRHIQELEYELVNVSKIFDEIGVKAVSINKLINGKKR